MFLTAVDHGQRYFWACWYWRNVDAADMVFFIWHTALMAAYASLQVLLGILYLAYYFRDGAFAGSGGVYTLVLYEIFLTTLPLAVGRDCSRPEPGTFTVPQLWLLLGTGLACLGMTIMSIVDVSNV